ncbi:MAG: hypothetical protein U0Q15_20665 [Kineosporiaceae bacterium]
MTSSSAVATRHVPLARRLLIRNLKALDLPPGDFVIAGSAPLWARDVVRRIADLDVVVRGAAWERALRLGPPQPAKFAHLQESRGVRSVEVPQLRIELLDGWFPGLWSVDELIRDAEDVEGWPFVPLDVVEKTKTLLDRPVDRTHLRALRASRQG